MKRFLNTLLAVVVMLGAAMPPVFAITDFNPSGDTGSQASSNGQSIQTNYPVVIPETRQRGNVRFPNMTIFGGDQNVNAPFNGTNVYSNIPCWILRPAGKRSRDGLDTTIIWTAPTGTRTYTIPDAGQATANFMLDAGTVSAATIQHATIPLSSAQILALNATPITLVPAAGAGTVISVNKIAFTMVTTATGYANGGNVTFQYAGGNAVTNNIAAAVVTAGAGTSYTVRDGIDVTAAANTAITITNATAPFITGTGTAVVDIWYSIK